MQQPPPQIDPLDFRAWAFADNKRKQREAIERNTHNSLFIQGDLVKLKICDGLPREGRRGAKGKIHGFTERSRLTLIRKLATWDWEAIGPAVFITLSYPDERALPSREDRNKQRYLFHRQMESAFGEKIPALWRVEYLPRRTGVHVGQYVPHWHIMLPGTRYIHHRHVRYWWGRAIAFGGYVRTDIKRIQNRGGAARYISKYIAKDKCASSLVYSTYYNNAGRHWGILRDELIPKCPIQYIHRIDDIQLRIVCEFAEQFLPWVNAQSPTSFTLLGLLAQDLIAFMKKYGLDEDPKNF